MHINPSQPLQANAMANPSGKQPPALAARAFLENNGDWASQPFGKLVSLFARGEDIPASPDAAPANAADPGPAAPSDVTDTTGQS